MTKLTERFAIRLRIVPLNIDSKEKGNKITQMKISLKPIYKPWEVLKLSAINEKEILKKIKHVQLQSFYTFIRQKDCNVGR